MKRPAARSSAPAAKKKPATPKARAQGSCPDEKPGTTRAPSSPKKPKPAKTAAEKTPEESQEALLQHRATESLGASPSDSVIGNCEVSSEAEALAPAGMLLDWDSFSSEKKLRILKEHAYRQPPAWLPTPDWLKSSPEEQQQGD